MSAKTETLGARNSEVTGAVLQTLTLIPSSAHRFGPGKKAGNSPGPRLSATRCTRARMPPDPCYGPTFLDMMRSCLEAIESFRAQDDVTKADVLDSMENRVALMMRKMVATPTTTSYCIFRE